ncbi:methylmalonyl-CoA mutase [candidate division LCP-89 bacterium B3_LCP]|uniref:Methylmalonyl-CoA mutase n=1 Tax=candidate division LCP-89 bacterium B3_LCP TaxID=2012998 RepID=A0A532UUG2_UNCL8|nr:MAG: methylmalonyl-CoA mutase [candidate division LCP-89 bacterium B3_LCP]
MNEAKKIRILLAKPGLDGHDRGIKVVAQALIEAGFEVIYTGLHQSIGGIVQAALQEDPDIIGLSILSGAHLPICNQLHKKLREAQLDEVPVVLGGVVPRNDFQELDDMGVKAIFTAGAKFDAIAKDLRSLVETS